MTLSDSNMVWSAPELGEREYAALARLIYEHSSISLGDEKRAFLRARLGRRLFDLKLNTFAERSSAGTSRSISTREGRNA